MQNLLCAQVRRGRGVHFSLQVPEGASGRNVQNLEMEFGVRWWTLLASEAPREASSRKGAEDGAPVSGETMGRGTSTHVPFLMSMPRARSLRVLGQRGRFTSQGRSPGAKKREPACREALPPALEKLF